MLSDPQSLSWFKPGMANVDSEFPNPFYGVETEEDQEAWPTLTMAGKCAMRWRGSVRLMARLRTTMSAEQLTTLRYEDLIRHPGPTGNAVSDFIGSKVAPIPVKLARRDGRPGSEQGAWRKVLTSAQLAEIDLVAGPELLRTGYGG
jgi:hypothetical protein